ncbi:MAG: VOC family protein [Gemmatimonadota bacterium]
MQTITPFLRYATEAEEAGSLHSSLLPDSRVTRVTTMPGDSPSRPAGSAKVVDFEWLGQSFTLKRAGPLDPCDHAVSFVINVETQDELDRYWDALLGCAAGR